jgi:hypothetical protein
LTLPLPYLSKKWCHESPMDFISLWQPWTIGHAHNLQILGFAELVCPQRIIETSGALIPTHETPLISKSS